MSEKTALDTFYDALEFLSLTRNEHQKIHVIYKTVKEKYQELEVSEEGDDGSNPS